MDQGQQQIKIGSHVTGLRGPGVVVEMNDRHQHATYARVRVNRPFHPGQTELMWLDISGLKIDFDPETQFTVAQEALRQWANKQGQDACWYYPDIFNELAVILKVNITAPEKLPHPAQFQEGCRKYTREIYP